VGGVSAGGGSTAVGSLDLAVLWLIAGALALLGGALVFAVKRPRRGE
jgi:LPXTG-motif cell wall-anchored protein